jgi:hypothetical protein
MKSFINCTARLIKMIKSRRMQLARHCSTHRRGEGLVQGFDEKIGRKETIGNLDEGGRTILKRILEK